jgi:RNA polymerase sigma factor (sigma-70 family)
MAYPDTALLEDETDGDAQRHVLLWDAYSGAIHRYCFRQTGDVALAEDLTSIVFLEAWRRRSEVVVEPEAKLPWLYGVATNVLRNQRRSQRRHRAALARLPKPRPEPDFADRVGERLEAEQQMRRILGQLGSLSQLEREVLSLCVWEGLTPPAAAVALAVPEATVRTRLHRARRHLRALSDADGVIQEQRLDPREGELR